MSSKNLRDAYRAFTTTCALITTDGPQGPNVMAAEWTFNVSYRPFLILLAIDPANRTHDMILESKEFGVNLVAEDQLAAMGFAGHYSKADTDKLSSRLFETFPAERIRAPLIRGAVLNAECRLVEHYPMGDHTAFLGEVLEFSVHPDKAPLVLHHGSHRLGERIARAPGIVVAATPMSAAPGDRITIAGELTADPRTDQPVHLELRDAENVVVGSACADTGPDGSFQVSVPIPSARGPGPWMAIALSGQLEGRARVAVSDSARPRGPRA